MSQILEYLKSSELVFKVQTKFGVRATIEEEPDQKKFKVSNKFLYYLFLVGTELGDEVFYGIFIPFVFFNVDCYLGRRFVFHWFLNMYIGQALKEIFRVVRPTSPAIQMQNKWSNEYSLPSTHSMGSLSIAGAIVYFSVDRYGLSALFGFFFIVAWVGVISLSRVYLGMHSVLDILMGSFLSAFFLMMFLPSTDTIMDFLLQNSFAPFFSLVLPILLIIFFPLADKWTPTRGDTCIVTAVFSGIEFGSWVNYQLGLTHMLEETYPLSLTFDGFLAFTARTVVGLAIIGLIEYGGKFSMFALFSAVVKENPKTLKSSADSLENKKKSFVDLSTKFVTYSLLSFTIVVFSPKLFEIMHINRTRFYSEF